MVVDSSAVVAMLRKEPGWRSLETALSSAERCRIPPERYPVT